MVKHVGAKARSLFVLMILKLMKFGGTELLIKFKFCQVHKFFKNEIFNFNMRY